jgi:cysteine synthase
MTDTKPEQTQPGKIHATLEPLTVPVDALNFYGKNPRRGDVEAIKESLERNGQYKPITVRAGSNEVLAGNHTLKAALALGWDRIAVTFVDVNDDEAARIVLVDNRTNDLATYDDEALREMLESIPDLVGTGYVDDDLLNMMAKEAGTAMGNLSLAERFGAPPFSVLDARQGSWQRRKQAWKDIGIESELGRDGDLIWKSPQVTYSNWYAIKNEADREAGRTLTGKEVVEKYGDRLEMVLGGFGTSIFDPVLCELMYRWYAPPGGSVLDPWAGGSVRGLVAARLGRAYTGIELRAEQVEANRAQAPKANGARPQDTDGAGAAPAPDFDGELTPIQEHGGYPVKRDDLFSIGGSRGGKVRTCSVLAERAKAAGAHTLVTAGSRQSPQVNIVATLARQLGMACRIHVPSGKLTPELVAARSAGAELVQHTPGYNTVITSRAAKDGAAEGHAEIPFGMECPEAVEMTASQVRSIAEMPVKPARIVIPVGSGMSAAGLLAGLRKHDLSIPVLGVQVGADPSERLNTYAPGWAHRLELAEAREDYHEAAAETRLGDLQLDPIYEAKCLPYLRPGDLLWVVGIRETAVERPAADNPVPEWITGESSEVLQTLPEEAYDMIIGCPPYYDLEVYSDDPRDLSAMSHKDFDAAMESNIRHAAARLKPDGYAVFIVSAVRDKRDGRLMDMRTLMVRAAAEAGLTFDNDAILVTSLGTHPMRAARTFGISRALCRTHQEVLIFLKGDRKRAAARMSAGETQASLDALDQVEVIDDGGNGE